MLRASSPPNAGLGERARAARSPRCPTWRRCRRRGARRSPWPSGVIAIDRDWSLPGEYGKPSAPSVAGSAARPVLVHGPDPGEHDVPVAVGHHRDVTREVRPEGRVAERGRAVVRVHVAVAVQHVVATASASPRSLGPAGAAPTGHGPDLGERAEDQAVGRALPGLPAGDEHVVVDAQDDRRVVGRRPPSCRCPCCSRAARAPWRRSGRSCTRRSRVAAPELGHRRIGDVCRCASWRRRSCAGAGSAPGHRSARSANWCAVAARVARADAGEVVVLRAARCP